MGTPVVQFWRGEGSDGDTTSGSGPTTEVSGSKARTRAAGSVRVGLFEASAVDLSLVATDGSHAPRIAASSGRKWSKASGKKTARQATTGNITASAAVLSSMGSTTGMSADDPIRVVGAGAAGVDLYSEILTVDGASQVTLRDNAGTTVTGNAVLDPEHLVLEDSFTLTSDTAWGVGGYRDDPWASGNTRLWLDWKPGWIVDLKLGADYDTTMAMVLTGNGDTTNGRLTIRGSGLLGRPTVTADNATSPFTIRGSHYLIDNLDFDDVDAGVLVDSSLTNDLICSRLSQGASVGIENLIRITSAATGERFHLRDLRTRKLTSGAVLIQGAVRGVLLENSILSDIDGGAGGDGLKVESDVAIEVRRCVFYKLGNGIIHTGGALNYGRVQVEQSIFDTCGKGYTATDVDIAKGLIFRNNVLRNCSGTALELVSGAEGVVSMVDYNCYFGNGTDRTGISAGANDLALDPTWANPETFDFRSGVLALRQAGWPRQTLDGETACGIDLGYQEVPIAVGGTVLLRVAQRNDLGTFWEFLCDVVTGATGGSRQTFVVVKTDEPDPTDTTPHEKAVVGPLEAALRDQTPENLIGREILA